MHRNHFIDQLRMLAALESSPATDRTLDAFRAVAREDFAGKGPWKVRSALADVSLPPKVTPDASPKWLYHCVLIVLNEEKGINIGDPSLWAGVLASTDIRQGERVLQVGAGVGYYTAVLSHLVGKSGQVVAYEVEPDLAVQCAKNLAGYPNVEVREGNPAVDLIDEGEFNLVVSFAGITHIPQSWTGHLAADARLVVPFTGDDWWGAMVLAQRSHEGFKAVTLGKCGFYPCSGARSDKLAAQITNLFSKNDRHLGWRFAIVDRNGDTLFIPEET